MPSIDFPNSPSIDDTYTVGSRSWKWNGTFWESIGGFGPTGPTGPANTLTVGTVSSTIPDGEPSVSITGTAPNQTISFVLPQGPTGPETSISIGTIDTGLPGSTAAASVTGAAGDQVLSLTIPQGPTGPQGTFDIFENAPTAPDEGDVWFNSTDGRFYVYYDSYWIEALGNEAGPTGPTGPAIDINVTGPITITGPAIAPTIGFNDSAYAQLSGAAFTGEISATAFTGSVASTTTALDFATETFKTISISATTTFTASNYAAGRTITVRVTSDATQRTLNFPSGWVFVGTKPTAIAASKTGILTITSFGTTEASCVAAWAVQS